MNYSAGSIATNIVPCVAADSYRLFSVLNSIEQV